MSSQQGSLVLLDSPIAQELMARISVKPEWVSILDFETRFPTAIEAAMAGL